MKSILKGAFVALAIGVAAQGALAAGPVVRFDAPDAVIKVAQGRNKAAAIGAAGGLAAGILLGGLLAQPAQAAAPVYVQPQDYGYQPPPPSPDYDAARPYYEPIRRYNNRDPGRYLEVCRRGVLYAARRYGAFDVRIVDNQGLRQASDGSLKFGATFVVSYPEGRRTARLDCNVANGRLIGARPY